MLILVNRFGSGAPSTWIGGERTIVTRASVPHRVQVEQNFRPAAIPLCADRRAHPPVAIIEYVIRPTLIAAAAMSLVLPIVFFVGCNKDIQNQEAVRQGVMSYLSKRSDLLAMDVSVTSVAFRQDEATAQVHFQAKGNSSPAAGMTMQYVLERKDGQWSVKGRTGAGAAHGGSGPGVNSVPGQGTLPGQLDGMPRVPAPRGAGSASLPAGHPAVGSESANQQK
jgi:hypothetical protein